MKEVADNLKSTRGPPSSPDGNHVVRNFVVRRHSLGQTENLGKMGMDILENRTLEEKTKNHRNTKQRVGTSKRDQDERTPPKRRGANNHHTTRRPTPSSPRSCTRTSQQSLKQQRMMSWPRAQSQADSAAEMMGGLDTER